MGSKLFNQPLPAGETTCMFQAGLYKHIGALEPRYLAEQVELDTPFCAGINCAPHRWHHRGMPA